MITEQGNISFINFHKKLMRGRCRSWKAITKLLMINKRDFQREICANSSSDFITGDKENSSISLNILICLGKQTHQNKQVDVNFHTLPHDQITMPIKENSKENGWDEKKNSNKSQHCYSEFSFNMPWDILIVYFPSTFPAAFSNLRKDFSILSNAIKDSGL